MRLVIISYALLVSVCCALWWGLHQTRQELDSCRAQLGVVTEQKEMLADAMKARREADEQADKRTSHTEQALDRNRDWSQCPLPDDIVRTLNECGASLSARTAGGLTPADCGVRAGACRAVCFLLQPANGGPGPGVPPAPLSPRMRGLLKSRASGQPSP